MQEVFKHGPTGDLYAVKSGRLNRLLSLTGERYLTIEAVIRLYDIKAQRLIPDAERTCQYALMNEALSYEMVVSQEEFKRDFVLVEGLGAQQNTDIEALVRQYNAEACDFSDIPWVVTIALMAAEGMRDSQSRCSLYTLAKHVEATLPEKVVLPE